MKFYITDESNISKDSKFDFFVYGGLVVDDSEMHKLCSKIFGFKQSLGIKKERPIKWNNFNWNGEGTLDVTKHSKIKELILNLISRSNCEIIICLSPQDFYHDTSFTGKIKSIINPGLHLRTQKYAITDCLKKFNSYLEDKGVNGIVIADMFSTGSKKDMGLHCFSLYPDGDGTRLDQIIYPVIQIDDHYSQIHQINDVVLGAIVFSMKEGVHNFLPQLKENFWKKDSDYLTILRRGINIYPRAPKLKSLEDKIKNLEEKFKRLIGIV